MSKPETTTAPPEPCLCEAAPVLMQGKNLYLYCCGNCGLVANPHVEQHVALCHWNEYMQKLQREVDGGDTRPTEAALREEVERLKAERDQWRNAIPSKCPFTGRGFFMLIEHPDLGWVPTYSSDPYDSYTIPRRDGANEEFYSYHYDHDEGGWADEVIGHGYRCDEPPTDD